MSYTMKNQDHSEESLIRSYFNPAMIAKAPRGFTDKTIARIEIESKKANPMKDFWRAKKVPVIAGALIFILISAAFLVPEGQTGRFGSVVMDYAGNFDLSFSFLKSLKLPELPGWLIYSIMGTVLMIAADIAFATFFEERDR